MKKAVLLAAAISVSALAQRSSPAEKLCIAKQSHAEARACLEAEAEATARSVQDAESSALAALDRWNEEPNYKSNSAAALRESSKAFAQMRSVQCGYLASLAAGGNGAGDRRLLCEIALNERRVADLRASIASLR
jgi:hypothetical protein